MFVRGLDEGELMRGVSHGGGGGMRGGVCCLNVKGVDKRSRIVLATGGLYARAHPA